MSDDKQWPNEPFDAKHVSGVKVQVTPVGMQASNLPGPPGDGEHWYEAEQRKKAQLVQRTLGPAAAKAFEGRVFPTADVLAVLLSRLEAAEARLAKLERPHGS